MTHEDQSAVGGTGAETDSAPTEPRADAEAKVDSAEPVADAGDPTPGETATGDTAASAEELSAELTSLRAEFDVLQRQLAEQTKRNSAKRRRPSRYWVSIVCVVLGGLLLPLAVLARWTSDTVLDTDSYVETVAPLAADEDIQEALSFRISVVVLDAIDFRAQAEEALPTEAAFLAAPIESGVRTVVQGIVDELVSTQAFERLWEDINRLGHRNVVAVLTGDGSDTVDTANGRVVVRLGPVVENVIERLDEILGTDLENAIPDERLDGEFVLVESEDLADLQDGIKLLDGLSWLIPIVSIGLLAASVIISRPRRLAFRRLGIAIVAPMIVTLLAYDWVRGHYVDGLPDDIHNPDAAAAFFDITTRFIPRGLWVLLVLGILILFVTWLFGPTGWAGRARSWWATLVGTAGDTSEGRDVGAAPRWVADNERTVLAFVFALGVLTLLVWTRPTGLVVLTVVVVVALLMGATGLVAEVGRRAIAADAASDDDPATDGRPADEGGPVAADEPATDSRAVSG